MIHHVILKQLQMQAVYLDSLPKQRAMHAFQILLFFCRLRLRAAYLETLPRYHIAIKSGRVEDRTADDSGDDFLLRNSAL